MKTHVKLHGVDREVHTTAGREAGATYFATYLRIGSVSTLYSLLPVFSIFPNRGGQIDV
jgi:hypothetical protein